MQILGTEALRTSKTAGNDSPLTPVGHALEMADSILLDSDRVLRSSGTTGRIATVVAFTLVNHGVFEEESMTT